MAFWNRSQKVLDRLDAIEKAVSVRTPQGTVSLPAQGTDLATARAQTSTYVNSLGMLPRDPSFGALFGPSFPLQPTPIDPMQPGGYVLPRRMEYPLTWNLQIGRADREVPWQLLADVADTCDVVRQCIEIRKHAISSMDWDIALTDAAAADLMEAEGEKSAARAQLIGKRKFAAEIDRIKRFLEEPDPTNGRNWSEWVEIALENYFVFDALAVYCKVDWAGEPEAFWVIDGSTIKPLLDEYGNTPTPPYVAYQQILYGFPRGEFTASPDANAEFKSSQLLYRPRHLRRNSPYGFSPVEKVLPLVDIYMRRLGWVGAEFRSGSVPRTLLEVTGPLSPTDRLQLEQSINSDLSGDSAARHQFKVLPPGVKPIPVPEMAEKYTSKFDDWIRGLIGAHFAVMPTQLGIIPTGTGGILGRGTMPGEQDISETLGDQPLEAWFVDTVNVLLRRFLGMSPELTLSFSGGGIDEDAQIRATTDQVMLNSGQKTLNQIRAENGDDQYEFAEANIPWVMTASGPEFLPGASKPPELAPGTPALPAKPAQSDQAQPVAKAEAKPEAKAEVLKFVTFARKREGEAWRDFQFNAVTPSLAKALNLAGQRADLEAVKVLAATVPKALAATAP